MQLGMIGLGRMGLNMTLRWLKGGHEIVAFNRSASKVQEVAKAGAVASTSLEDLIAQLKPPRAVWLMLPIGEVLENHIQLLAQKLAPGDLLIDGGNTHFKDDLRHAELLAAKKIRFLDAGVSGGVWGLANGYCTMIGGTEADFRQIEPLLKTLAPANGYLYCGPTGAGHFVKMVHNGIEYGMMQAYAEGFDLIQASPYGGVSLPKVAQLWNQGSVVRSWLLELLERALAQDPQLESLQGYVEDSGEGRWTVEQAVELGVAAPVITASLFQRFSSRQNNAFSNRVLAALRNQFGGHATVKSGEAAPIEGGALRPARAEKK